MNWHPLVSESGPSLGSPLAGHFCGCCSRAPYCVAIKIKRLLSLLGDIGSESAECGVHASLHCFRAMHLCAYLCHNNKRAVRTFSSYTNKAVKILPPSAKSMSPLWNHTGTDGLEGSDTVHCICSDSFNNWRWSQETNQCTGLAINSG